LMLLIVTETVEDGLLLTDDMVVSIYYLLSVPVSAAWLRPWVPD
jgi:hypothetical protein